ncbi:hypothetical protein ABPG75_008084 [Micractinium tetrahymenae]
MSRLLLAVTALLFALAGAQAAMCDPKDGWQNFELGGGSVPKNVAARAVLNKSVTHVVAELRRSRELPAGCALARIYVSKDCMKPHIVKNVVQYGVYDSMEKLLLVCPSGDRIWYQVHTRTKVGRRGSILHIAHTAKKIDT